jgi:hypothetical protein
VLRYLTVADLSAIGGAVTEFVLEANKKRLTVPVLWRMAALPGLAVDVLRRAEFDEGDVVRLAAIAAAAGAGVAAAALPCLPLELANAVGTGDDRYMRLASSIPIGNGCSNLIYEIASKN